jgi:hypothetical protein
LDVFLILEPRRETMKPFNQMTADELAAYDGPVYTARCTLRHRHTGTIVPHDFEAPTRELRDKTVADVCRDLGQLLTRTDYNPKVKP